jgi:ribosomal protein S18 acetylase RimI-like enzyme
MMDTEIRLATPGDIPTLVAIIKTSFTEVADRLGLPPDKDSKHASNITNAWIIGDMDKGVRYYIIEADGTPAGSVTVEHARPEVCYIGRLAVLPGYQGRGLGKKLLTFAIDEAAKTGADHASIGVISDEERLVRWYRRMGFTVNRRIRFKHFTFEVTLMRRELKEKS